MNVPYAYQPYPKMITAPDGARLRVETEADHLAKLAEWEGQTAVTEPAPVVVETTATPLTRAGLLEAAATKGVKVDRRWSDRRIAEAVGVAA